MLRPCIADRHKRLNRTEVAVLGRQGQCQGVGEVRAGHRDEPPHCILVPLRRGLLECAIARPLRRAALKHALQRLRVALTGGVEKERGAGGGHAVKSTPEAPRPSSP